MTGVGVLPRSRIVKTFGERVRFATELPSRGAPSRGTVPDLPPERGSVQILSRFRPAAAAASIAASAWTDGPVELPVRLTPLMGDRITIRRGVRRIGRVMGSSRSEDEVVFRTPCQVAFPVI